jgi:hypothetical protein
MNRERTDYSCTNYIWIQIYLTVLLFVVTAAYDRHTAANAKVM